MLMEVKRMSVLATPGASHKVGVQLHEKLPTLTGSHSGLLTDCTLYTLTNQSLLIPAAQAALAPCAMRREPRSSCTQSTGWSKFAWHSHCARLLRRAHYNSTISPTFPEIHAKLCREAGCIRMTRDDQTK